MLTKDIIEKFYEDFSKLDLKFPVAAISKATGFGKPAVSQYLSKKLDPSENFINAFYKRFADSLKNVLGGQVTQTANSQGKGHTSGEGLKSPVNASHPYLEKYISLLEKENEHKREIIETNLTGLVIGQKSILAHLAVSLEGDALRDAGGDKRKAVQLKESMDMRIGEVLTGKKNRDTSGKSHNR